MAIIESLPPLEELTGLAPVFKVDSTQLDKLFAAHGKTLKKLQFSNNITEMPRAFLEKNNILISLEILSDWVCPTPDLIIKICSTKQKGFVLTVQNPDSKMDVNDYIQIVKACPQSVIRINVHSQ